MTRRAKFELWLVAFAAACMVIGYAASSYESPKYECRGTH